MRTSSVDQVILDVLADEHHHLTAQEVFEHIRERMPAVNSSTIYRSLDRLAAEGKISVSDMGKGAMVFESVADGMHHHLVCQNCGNSFTVDHHLVGGFFAQVQEKYHFEVLTNHLILFGVCQNCQAGILKD
jgi:Fur family ferric uptake transcriptional regulator